MGQRPTSKTPLRIYDNTGTELTQAPGADGTVTGRGVYTLASGQHYYVECGGEDCPFQSVHMQHDDAIIITSATVQDSNLPDVTIYSTVVGEWISESPSTAYVGTAGANTTATNGVVAVTGGARGGAMWHLGEDGARRTRIDILVGGTGGEVRFSQWGKE